MEKSEPINPYLYAGLQVKTKKQYISSLFNNKVRAEGIKKVVYEYFSSEASPFSYRSRKRDQALPRQVAMYFIRHKTDISTTNIGHMFNKHHSTVIYNVQVIEGLIDVDHKFSALIHDIEGVLDGYIKRPIPKFDELPTVADADNVNYETI